MNNTQSLGSRIRKIGLAAFVAAGAIVVIGLASPARAAGYMKFDGVDGEVVEKQEQMNSKSAELEAALASLTAQMATVEALSLELQRMGGDITVLHDSAKKGNVEFSWKVEEGEKIFTEQISALLDPAVAQAVMSNFEQLKSSFRDEDADNDNLPSLDEGFSALVTAVDLCRDGIQDLVTASTSSLAIVKQYDKATPKLAEAVAK